MAIDAVILDLDGTLVDSNLLHVHAWVQAFKRFGYDIPEDRIFTEVGKGGDTLVPSILGEQRNRRDGEGLRKAEPEEFAALAEKGLRVFPGARELLEALHDRGLKTVLATSSGQASLKRIEAGSGLPVSQLVDAVVSADDAERSKPAPDLVKASVAKLKLSPAQCVMLGDTPYDAQSAKHAGVIAIGLTCGGNSIPVLRRSGARRVYNDPADLLAHLEEALEAVSPGPAHLTTDLMQSLMRKALQQAEEGMNAGEVPIGCVLARGDGSIIGAGYNELNRAQNRTAHAEMVTFGKAAGKVPVDARDLILVSTLEPCVMCTGAAMEAAVDTIVFGLAAPADSGTGRVAPPESPESQMPRIVGGVLAAESRKLLERWIGVNGNKPQAAYVRQLLSLV